MQVPDPQAHAPTPICAIGASAGGVKALQSFFRQIPDRSRPRLCRHPPSRARPSEPAQRDPAGVHPDAGARRSTTRPRSARTASMSSRPTASWSSRATTSHARPFTEPRGQRAPIDMFFRSIAAARGDGLAVVLSGAGSDGALGVRAIKEAGGVVFVQEPAEAEFPMMPRSAIATGVGGFRRAASRGWSSGSPKWRAARRRCARSTSDGAATICARIISFLRARTGHDFSSYKRATVMRRIAAADAGRRGTRALRLCRSYLVEQSGRGAGAVRRPADLGHACSFATRRPSRRWRDRRSRRCSTIGAARPGIRVWVVGLRHRRGGLQPRDAAAGGGRAAAGRRADPDLRQRSRRRRARDGARGPLSARIEADVSEERLQRFFVDEGTHYRISKEVRDMRPVRDPQRAEGSALHAAGPDHLPQPADLPRARAAAAALRAVPLRAAPQAAILFLGSAETVDATPELFVAVDREARIYRARPARAAACRSCRAAAGHRADCWTQHGRTPQDRRGRRRAGVAGAIARWRRWNARRRPARWSMTTHADRCTFADGGPFHPAFRPGPFSADSCPMSCAPNCALDLRGALRPGAASRSDDADPADPGRLQWRSRSGWHCRSRRSPDERLAPRRRWSCSWMAGRSAADEATRATSRRRERESAGCTRNCAGAGAAGRQPRASTRARSRTCGPPTRNCSRSTRNTARPPRSWRPRKEELQSINEELQTVNAELKSKLREHLDRAQRSAEPDHRDRDRHAVPRSRAAHPDVHAGGRRACSTSPTPISAGRSPISPIGSHYDGDRTTMRAQVLRDLAPLENEVKTRTAAGC